MSVEITTLVKMARMPGAVEKIVAWAMADYANKEGAGIYPSNQTLADDCDLSRTTVIETIAALEEAGLIETASTGAGGHYKNTSVRRLDIEALLSISRGNVRLGIPKGPKTYVVTKVPATDAQGRPARTKAGKPKFWTVHALVETRLIEAENAAAADAEACAKTAPTGTAPVLVRHPYQYGTRTPPVRHPDSTSTAPVPNPSGIRQGTVTLPLPPSQPAVAEEGECGKDEDELGAKPGQPVQDAPPRSAEVVPVASPLPLPKRWRGAEAALAAIAPAVAERFLRPLMAQPLHPPFEADPAAYVRTVGEMLAACTPAALDRMRADVARVQVRDMPAAAKLAPMRDVHAVHERNTAASQQAVADLALPPLSVRAASRWAEFRAEFARLSSVVADADLLGTAHPLGLDGEPGPPLQVTLVVGNAGVRAALQLGHSAQLRAAATVIGGPAADVLVITADSHRRARKFAA